MNRGAGRTTRRLFEDLIVSTHDHPRRGALAWPASAAVHALIVAAAVGAAAVTPAELPEPPDVAIGPVPFPVVSMPQEVRRPSEQPRRGGPRRSGSGPVMPQQPPPSVADLLRIDTLPAAGDDPGTPVCLTDCDGGYVISPSDDSGPGQGRPGSEPVRAGVHVAPPRKLRDAGPAYPELARRVGAQGTVIIECRIDENGRVVGARVLRGHPLLDAAALEAVEQWLYTPTLLNGVPVSVLMTVTVRFELNRSRR
jgi:protein TonB